jgi:hypothetical protein
VLSAYLEETEDLILREDPESFERLKKVQFLFISICENYRPLLFEMLKSNTKKEHKP